MCVGCFADMLPDETAGAIHTLDTFLQTPQNPKSVELMAMLASIRATSRPGMTDKDKLEEKAREEEAVRADPARAAVIRGALWALIYEAVAVCAGAVLVSGVAAWLGVRAASRSGWVG